MPKQQRNVASNRNVSDAPSADNGQARVLNGNHHTKGVAVSGNNGHSKALDKYPPNARVSGYRPNPTLRLTLLLLSLLEKLLSELGPSGKLFEKFKGWIRTVEDQETLRRLEVLIQRRRDELVDSGQSPVPLKSLGISTSRKIEYIVESWRDENGENHKHSLGTTIPPDYDLSLVVVSKRVREKIGHLL